MTAIGRGAWLPAGLLALLLVPPIAELDVGGEPVVVNGLDLAAFGLAVAGMFVAVRRRQLLLDRALVSYGAMCAVILVQIVRAPEAAATIAGGLSRFVAAGMVLFGLHQLAERPTAQPPPADRRFGLAQLVGAFGIVLGAWVVVELVAALLSAPEGAAFYDVKNQVVVPLGASNYLAGFLVMPLVLAATHLAGSERRDTTAFWIGVLVASTLGVLATLSRAAWGALVLIGIVAVVQRMTRAALGRVVAWTAGATVVVSVALAVVGDRVVGSVPSTVGSRLELIGTAWEGFLDQPILGVGINRLLTLTEGTAHVHDSAHNLTVHALATVGVVGAVIYAVLWTDLLRRSVDGPRSEHWAVALLALFVMSAGEPLAFTRGIEVLLAVVLWWLAPPPRVVPIGRGGGVRSGSAETSGASAHD